MGYSPWGCKESDMTERLHFDFSLSEYSFDIYVKPPALSSMGSIICLSLLSGKMFMLLSAGLYEEILQ